MPSNSLPEADLNLPEMKTKSPSCPSGGVHMYGTLNIVHFPRKQFAVWVQELIFPFELLTLRNPSSALFLQYFLNISQKWALADMNH